MNQAIPLKERTIEEYAKEKGKTVEEILSSLPIQIIDVDICQKSEDQQT